MRVALTPSGGKADWKGLCQKCGERKRVYNASTKTVQHCS